MKTLTALAIAGCVVLVPAVQAGPSINIFLGTGGGCQQPVICQPQPVVCQRVIYPAAFCAPAPVVYYNPAPVFYGGTVTRFSNVIGFINGGQGVIQVSEPVYPVQPVVVYPQSTFRWR